MDTHKKKFLGRSALCLYDWFVSHRAETTPAPESLRLKGRMTARPATVSHSRQLQSPPVPDLPSSASSSTRSFHVIRDKETGITSSVRTQIPMSRPKKKNIRRVAAVRGCGDTCSTDLTSGCVDKRLCGWRSTTFQCFNICQ